MWRAENADNGLEICRYGENRLYLLGIENSNLGSSMVKRVFIGIWHFYRDGFRQMTWGRVLWLIILLKLLVMFAMLRLFFFPDFLGQAAGGDRDGYVSNELVGRAPLSD